MSRRIGAGAMLLELSRWMQLVRRSETVTRVRQVIRSGYDLIHVNNTLTYQPGTLIAAWRSCVPVVAHVRNPVEPGRFTRYLMRRAACVVCVNEQLKSDLSSLHVSTDVRTCRDPVGRVPVCADSSENLRRTIAGPRDIIVGSLGRLEPQKGFDYLIRAAPLILRSSPNTKFVIAGDGTSRGELEALIASLGLKRSFHMLGFREDTGTVLGALDVFVCPSLWEGGPLTVVEAMQIGRAVVSTPVGIVPEIIRDRSNGLLVPGREHVKLAAAVVELLRDPALRMRLSAAAFTTAQQFGEGKIQAQQLDEIFSDVLTAAQKK